MGASPRGVAQPFTGAPWSRVHTILAAATMVHATGCSASDQNAGGGAAGGGGTGGGAGAAPVDVGPQGDPAAPFYERDRVLEIAIELAESEWDALRGEARSVEDVFLSADCQAAPFTSPFSWKEATVTVDGERRERVGVRKKGFLGSLSETKPSLKISMDHFVSQDLLGVEDFTLNNADQDLSYVSQCLGYALFASAGVPAPRCNFARVSVNGQPLGVYVNVEPVKKPFLRRAFSEDAGDLYEGTLSDFRPGWLGTFEAKTALTDPTGAPLAAVVDAANAPPSEVMARLGSVIELDAFASFWATEVLTAHWDGYARNTNNFYVYRETSSGRFTFLPWGTDQLFGISDGDETGDSIDAFTQGRVASALYASTEGRALLLDRLSALLDTAWDEEQVSSEIDRWVTQLRPLLDATEHVRFDSAVESVRGFVSARRSALTAAIAAAPATPVAQRGSICFENVGTVNGTFATTWGTTGADDPFSAGTGTLDAVVDGVSWVHLPGFVGAVAGPNQEPGKEGEAQLVIIGLRSDAKLSFMAFGLDPADAVVGTHELDLAATPAVLMQADPNVTGSEQVMGIVLGGALTFDAVGMIAGDAVSGTFSGTLYRSGLFGM